MGAPHFPILPLRAVQFAAICREEGTYRAYLSHIKSARELISRPIDWAEHSTVKRAKEGLAKSALIFKGPRLSVSSGLIVRIASVSCEWAEPWFFCI